MDKIIQEVIEFLLEKEHGITILLLSLLIFALFKAIPALYNDFFKQIKNDNLDMKSDIKEIKNDIESIKQYHKTGDKRFQDLTNIVQSLISAIVGSKK